MAGVQIKVCGLKTAANAAEVADAGADYLGFNFYPKSPRYVSWPDYEALRAQLPAKPRVAVMVEPGLAELLAAQRAAFDAVQIHFNLHTPHALLREWSDLVTPKKLWLVPKLPPAQAVPESLLPLAETFLLDTFHAEKFGGTGQVGDWSKFRWHVERFPDHRWVLSGGLGPANVAQAIRESGAVFIDVNSGVESSPGIKDPERLRALAQALAVGRD